MKFIVVIPARFESSRLPGKPLIDINGIPMIVRTYMQCIKAVLPEFVFVATDDVRISEVCDKYNINSIMTSSNILTGTDRVYEISKLIDAEYYINIQGDEPIFNPQDITKLISSIDEFPDTVLNGYTYITDKDLFFNVNIPKVVTSLKGRLLYISRSPIPSGKTTTFTSHSKRQVCAYAFPKSALEFFSLRKSKTPLESVEDIEIIRFLELGLNIQMVEMSSLSISVDNFSDVKIVEDYLNRTFSD